MNDIQLNIQVIIWAMITIGLFISIVVTNRKRKETEQELLQLSNLNDKLEEAMYKTLSIPKRDYFDNIASIRRIEEKTRND